MTEIRTFAGLTIDGEITRGDDRKNQRPKEELAPLMQALLDDEAIVAFGWTQYTPYFNDGQPCIFGAHELWVRTKWDTAAVSTYKLTVGSSHPSLGGQRWDADRHVYVTYVNEHYNPQRLERCESLSCALIDGEFDDALIELFGDHAEVAVTRDGISVTSYEHD